MLVELRDNWSYTSYFILLFTQPNIDTTSSCCLDSFHTKSTYFLESLTSEELIDSIAKLEFLGDGTNTFGGLAAADEILGGSRNVHSKVCFFHLPFF